MAFSTDYTDVKEGSGGILPIGEYETIIKYAGEDATKNGVVYINVTMVVRNDVEQKFKNKHIWHELWHRKNPTPADLSCGGYSFKQIQSLSKATGLPNGKKYESLADWCEELANKAVRITVEHEEFPEGSGKIRARVKWVNESKFPNCSHEWKPTASGQPQSMYPEQPGFYEITDDDDKLPF